MVRFFGLAGLNPAGTTAHGHVMVTDTANQELSRSWHGILHQWPFSVAYATSFITIGGIWLADHHVFRRLQHVNDRLMRLNLLLLMTVSFLPFPTRLVAEAIRNTDAERTAASSLAPRCSRSPCC